MNTEQNAVLLSNTEQIELAVFISTEYNSSKK
jgi:hypothetical protein